MNMEHNLCLRQEKGPSFQCRAPTVQALAAAAPSLAAFGPLD